MGINVNAINKPVRQQPTSVCTNVKRQKGMTGQYRRRLCPLTIPAICSTASAGVQRWM
jgi:hypothetical protein